jgi:hypothetical protein
VFPCSGLAKPAFEAFMNFTQSAEDSKRKATELELYIWTDCRKEPLQESSKRQKLIEQPKKPVRLDREDSQDIRKRAELMERMARERERQAQRQKKTKMGFI